MSVLKTRSQRAAANVPLILECEEEELSETQKEVLSSAEREYKDAVDKINEMIKNQTILHKSNDVMVLQSNSNENIPPSVPALSAISQKNKQPILNQGGVMRPAGTSTARLAPTTYQLVVNPSLGSNVGFLVGSVSSSTAKSTGIQGNMTMAKSSTPLQLSSVGGRPLMQSTMGTQGSVLPTIKLTQNKAPPGKVAIPTITAVPNVASLQAPSNMPLGPLGQLTPVSTTTSAAAVNVASVPTVDLTDGDDDRADSREIVFNKLSGKTFPSLVVLARPNLRIKDLPPATTAKERASMDARVKSVLIYSPTKFTEWLIQQGMVRSEQCCLSHFGSDSKSVKLKLGMYSDASKFPYSGGYVWISECCPQRFVSVFSGSLFEGAPHPPTVLLKLIYHWACQTSVSNVVQWVKVDNFYVKNFFTHLRALCTAAVHTKMGLVGGVNRFVEVGVISLGTTSQDGQQRQVKVEVLGVLDKEGKLVRLRAVEPMQDGDRNLKRRFAKILEPLALWVHPGSTILTDFSIDKATLNSMGFNNVHQANASDGGVIIGGKRHSNQNVMEYLRKIVPRMFLNTLSLLNRSLIQQFLDELTWRECWGPLPAQAFDNIIQHIAEQTKAESGDPLVKRLGNIAANPFKNWNYLEPQPRNNLIRIAPSQTQNFMLQMQTGNDYSMEVNPQALCEVQYAPGPASSKRPKAQRQPQAVVPEAQAHSSSAGAPSSSGPQTAVKRIKLNTSDQTYLDAYYYAEMPGNPQSIIEDMDSNFNVKCVVCPQSFSNNIALMKHVISHVIYESSDQNTKRFLFCPYCLKRMQTSTQLANHKKECHQNTTAVMACSICQGRFPTRAALVKHMHVKHVASEMPFRCGVCQFRTSFHLKAVDHFYESHTGGTALQCPLCMKIFYACGVRSRGNYINLMGYYQHLVGHKRQSQRRKCERCLLVFQQTKHVQEHDEFDHKTMRNIPKVVPVVSTESNPTIIIPIPKGGPPLPQHPQPIPRTPTTASATANRSFTSIPHQAPLRTIASPSANCIECNQPLVQRYHLSTVMSCLRCRYVTCCLAAMELHTKKFHSGQHDQLKMGKDTKLEKSMFCICGFKANKGNVLATHLAKCEKRSAYPNPGVEAQSASFPPLVTLDDGEGPAQDPDDQWMKAYVKPAVKEEEKQAAAPDTAQASGSMLDVLGLVRKASSDEDPPAAVKDASAAEEVKDVSAAEEVKDVSVAEEMKDVSAAEEMKDVSAAEEMKDVSAAEEMKDVSAAEEMKDVSAAEEMKDVSAAEEMKDVSAAEEKTDTVPTDQETTTEKVPTPTPAVETEEPMETETTSAAVEENVADIKADESKVEQSDT